jgi:spore coat polysaccharide biosynthesis protein SpsF
MTAVAIIQARMGSSRLPGKILAELAGQPMLARCVARLGRAQMLDDLLVATTTSPVDDVTTELCATRGWRCFRGSEDDVLDRYYQAARLQDMDVVVRVTSDCPFIEPEIVDRVIREFSERQPDVDYASNVIPERTYPRGLDVEVFTVRALERAWREDDNAAWREHVTEYITRNPDRFRLHGVCHPENLSQWRWTVDTAEDLRFARLIYTAFGHDLFSWRDVLVLLAEHPEWAEINRDIPQKSVE